VGVWANHAAETGFLEPLTTTNIADALNVARLAHHIEPRLRRLT
jgi:hypothetical protein